MALTAPHHCTIGLREHLSKYESSHFVCHSSNVSAQIVVFELGMDRYRLPLHTLQKQQEAAVAIPDTESSRPIQEPVVSYQGPKHPEARWKYLACDGYVG